MVKIIKRLVILVQLYGCETLTLTSTMRARHDSHLEQKKLTEDPRLPLVRHEAERAFTRGSLNGKHIYLNP